MVLGNQVLDGAEVQRGPGPSPLPAARNYENKEPTSNQIECMSVVGAARGCKGLTLVLRNIKK